jgi:ATP-binding cassette subfamily F protein 3
LRKIAGHTQDQQLRTFLGGFGFPGQRVLEPVRIFSGGEKSRLALALIVWQKPNLLLLDEPTNHLDLEMRHALSMALQEYQGAMILVSHDRFLVRTTVDQLILVANGQVEPFEGDLNEYEKWLFEFRRQTENRGTKTAKPDVSRKEQRQLDAKERELRRPLVAQIKKLEEQLAKLEKESLTIETKLEDQSLYEDANKELLQKCLEDQVNIKVKLKSIEQEWLQACEKLEELNK